MNIRPRRWMIFVLAGLAALVFAGVVIGSKLVAPPDVASLDAATENAPMIPLAQIDAANGKPARGVFAQITATGQFCMWDAPSAGSPAKLGGCNPAEDPLGGRRLSASLAYEGGPSTQAVSDARLIGIADRNVSSVAVLLSDGRRLEMHLRAVNVDNGTYRVFAYRFRRHDLQGGVGPVAVVALDASGAEVDRQPTGFGG